MPTDVTIRPATGSDQPDLARLGLIVQNAHAAAHPHIFRLDVTPFDETHVAELLADDTTALLVAELEGTLAGCIVVSLRQAPDHPISQPRTFAKVGVLVVDPAVRRRGIGRLLMDAARAWASEQDASSLELDVWESNTAAIAFYEHLGLRTMRRNMTLPLNDASSWPDNDANDAAEA